MTRAVSTTLSDQWYQYVVNEAKKQKTTKREIFERALQNDKKEKLRMEITEGLRDSKRQKEYQKIADEFHILQTQSITPWE